VDPQETAIAELETSPFSQDCRVFAPMYRSYTDTATGTAAVRVAYHSVFSAWRDCLWLAGSCWPVICRGLLGQLEHDPIAGFSGGGETTGRLGTFGISIHEELKLGLYS
jgi:Protein of unknown function (DUF3089)